MNLSSKIACESQSTYVISNVYANKCKIAWSYVNSPALEVDVFLRQKNKYISLLVYQQSIFLVTYRFLKSSRKSNGF